MREKCCNQLLYENLKRPLWKLCPDTFLRRQVFLRITCQICYNHLCQICYKPSFVENFSQTLFFEKVIFLLARSWNHLHSFSGNYMFKGIALIFSTWSLHVFLELSKRLFFASAAGHASSGLAPNVCRVRKTTLLILKACKLKHNAHFPKPFACS